jgi:hypothetical protein
MFSREGREVYITARNKGNRFTAVSTEQAGSSRFLVLDLLGRGGGGS